MESEKLDPELKARAIIIIGEIPVSMSLAYAYAEVEKIHFVHTGHKVDIVDLFNKNTLTLRSFYDESVFRSTYLPKNLNFEKLNFEKLTIEDISGKYIPLENEPSKFFGKSKHNYRK